MTGGNTEQLGFHLNKAKENGLTEEELVEVITHLLSMLVGQKQCQPLWLLNNCF
ncbi:carboxymuconolactone decarboxylase family protein [Peribacillus butanolivorans]|uniref:carboxymuconolactone decarboxylase family protein n=1 Tax=Peribacillus butanolivorans TaxID=421767 RepID=UPI00399D092A